MRCVNITLLLLQWVLFLLSNNTFVDVRCVNITLLLLQWVLFLSSNNTFVNVRCVNITFMLLQWVLFLSSNNTFVNVRCVNITLLLLQWVLFLSSNNTFVNVRYVNFHANLSVFPKCYQTDFLSSHALQVWIYFYTCLSLFKPFLLLISLDKNLLHFPNKNNWLSIKKCFYSTMHTT